MPKDILPSQTKYHPLEHISELQNRITDNFLTEYAHHFYTQLTSLDRDVDSLKRQIALLLQEQSKVASLKSDSDSAEEIHSDLKIRVKEPLQTRFSQEWQKKRPSVRLMDRVGIRRV